MAFNLSATSFSASSAQPTQATTAERLGASNTESAQSDFAQLYAQEQSHQKAKPVEQANPRQDSQKQESKRTDSVHAAKEPIEKPQQVTNTPEQNQDRVAEQSEDDQSSDLDSSQEVEPLLIITGAEIPPTASEVAPALNFSLTLGQQGAEVVDAALSGELDPTAQVALDSDIELQKLGASMMPFMMDGITDTRSAQQKFTTLMQRFALSQTTGEAAVLDADSLEQSLLNDLGSSSLLSPQGEQTFAGLTKSEGGAAQSFSDALVGQWGQTEGASGKAGSSQALVPGAAVALRQSGWSQAVVDRVLWMSSQNIQSAEINLEPAELGRLAVRIDMSGDQAQVVFTSGQAGVRDVLESQLPRLRELFNQQGLNLADVNVASQFAGNGRGEQDAQRAKVPQTSSLDSETDTSSPLASSGHAISVQRLVDYYA